MACAISCRRHPSALSKLGSNIRYLDRKISPSEGSSSPAPHMYVIPTYDLVFVHPSRHSVESPHRARS
eukprot:30401-Pelagococcus_subviridis.AAC.5